MIVNRSNMFTLSSRKNIMLNFVEYFVNRISTTKVPKIFDEILKFQKTEKYTSLPVTNIIHRKAPWSAMLQAIWEWWIIKKSGTPSKYYLLNYLRSCLMLNTLYLPVGSFTICSGFRKLAKKRSGIGRHGDSRCLRGND